MRTIAPKLVTAPLTKSRFCAPDRSADASIEARPSSMALTVGVAAGALLNVTTLERGTALEALVVLGLGMELVVGCVYVDVEDGVGVALVDFNCTEVEVALGCVASEPNVHEP
jgi:hypothetical protein